MGAPWRSTSAVARVARVALVALAASALALGGCGKKPVDAPLVWASDVEASVAKARHEDKLVLVYFGASWDTAAKELEYTTFTDPEVRFLLRRDFVTVRVDATDDEDPWVRKQQERFKVVGDPTIVILGRDGASEVARFNEYVRPDTFASSLRRATRPDAIREARFEAAARARADEARWEEARRNLPPGPVIVLDFADAMP